MALCKQLGQYPCTIIMLLLGLGAIMRPNVAHMNVFNCAIVHSTIGVLSHERTQLNGIGRSTAVAAHSFNKQETLFYVCTWTNLTTKSEGSKI